MLTPKLNMLTALTSSTRAHEICSLNRDILVKHPAHYSFQFSKFTKTARQGKLRPPVELTQFSDKNFCVCHDIDVYLEKKDLKKK